MVGASFIVGGVGVGEFFGFGLSKACLLVLGLASVLEYWRGDFPSAGLGGEIGFCRLILAWVRLIGD